MLLILDLDNTIFETRSIDLSVLDPAKKIIDTYAVKAYGEGVAGKIIEELKETPFDIVARKYRFPKDTSMRFYREIQSITYDLKIEVYEDYPVLKQLNYGKFLVTTGMTNFQQAKIDALRIAPDFQKIIIDDPFDIRRKFKKGIFQDILEETGTDPRQVWVIGDKPDSELRAGKELGLKTIQRLGRLTEKSAFSDHVIRSFEELKDIIN